MSESVNPRPRPLSEAAAFDRQIDDRARNGHVPDLRRAVPCEYFYNNPWRHPVYVALDFGEQFALLHEALVRHLPAGSSTPRLLEVGCGPGYMSLEFARAGCDVTGIDVSEGCIAVAERFALEDPWKTDRGALRYLAGDFFTHRELVPDSFDAVYFVGALHHFGDQLAVMRRVTDLLRPGGLVLAHEPTRDRVTRGNAAFVHVLRVLLSAAGGYYRQVAVPSTPAAHESEVTAVLSSLRYEGEAGQKLQSEHDNDAGHAEMHAALTQHFTQVDYRDRYAYFHEMIGGLRFEESVNAELARFLRDADAMLCGLGVLQPTEFFFAGRTKKGVGAS